MTSQTKEKINRYDGGPYHWFLPDFYARKHEWPLHMFASQIKPSERILDLGAGDGRHSALLARRAYAVIGLDYQLLPLRFAQLLVPNQNVHFVCADGTLLPLQSRAFDWVTCFDVIEHVPEPRAAQLIQEAYRVLRPGGTLAITTPNRTSLHNQLWGHHLSEKHYYEYSMAELCTLLATLGFSVGKKSGIYLPPPILRRHLEHYASVFPIRSIFRFLIRAGNWLPELSETLYVLAKRDSAALSSL
jgi:SAM-dependent methyltransferase